MKFQRNRSYNITLFISTLVFLFTSIFIGFITSTTFFHVSAQADTLVSAEVHDEAPTLDGDASDHAWEEATSITIATVGGSSGSTVTLKATHTDTDLFILAEWEDTTMSITKSGSWNWDGDAWTMTGMSQSEDRIAFLWDINMTNFLTMGCNIKCHLQYGDAGAFLDNEGDVGDIWHMKAASSLGVTSLSQSSTLTVDPETHEVTAGSVTLIGYADDKHLTYENPSSELPEDGGRHGDIGRSTYEQNRNTDGSGPLYLEIDPSNYIDAMVLTQNEINGGETIEINTATDADITTAWNKYELFNAVVPEKILREPEGSRGDVLQAATWSEGTWTTEFKRSLVTSYRDDIQFSDLDGIYIFSISLMDNSGGGSDHSIAINRYALEFHSEEHVSEIRSGVAIPLLFACSVILTVAATRRRRKNK